MPQCGHNREEVFVIVISDLEGRISKYSGKKTINKMNTAIVQKTGEELPRLLASWYTQHGSINVTTK